MKSIVPLEFADWKRTYQYGYTPKIITEKKEIAQERNLLYKISHQDYLVTSTHVEIIHGNIISQRNIIFRNKSLDFPTGQCC